MALPTAIQESEQRIDQMLQQDTTPPPAPVEQHNNNSEIEIWKSRYGTLQGKYNKEVQEQRETNQKLQQQIQQLQDQVSAAKTTPFSELRNRGYDDDIVGALESLQSENRKLHEQVNKLIESKERVDRIENTVVQDAAQRFLQELTVLYPEWKTVNVDPKFHAFLEQEDDVTGLTRQQLLQAAEQARSAKRVATIFNAFKETKERNRPKDNISPSAYSGRTSSDGKRIFTVSEIKRFWDDVVRNRYAGRDDEVKRIEAEINQANIEGRIRQG
jgi:hypothetical protein